MVENQYISVKEFAERAGKSVQAIYKGLNNRLNQYVKLVDNQKMLDIKALQEVYGIEVEQPIQPELTTDSTEETVIDTLLEEIEILRKEWVYRRGTYHRNFFLRHPGSSPGLKYLYQKRK